jgi:hypothetical protein
MLLGKIKERKLIIKGNYSKGQPIELDAEDLTHKLGKSITKFIGK